MRTIARIKKRFVEEGFDAVLERKPTSREYMKRKRMEILRPV